MMGDTAARRMFIGEDCGTMNRKNMRQEKESRGGVPPLQTEVKELVSKEGKRGMVNAERTMGSGGLFSFD